jgi:hypothetical protein
VDNCWINETTEAVATAVAALLLFFLLTGDVVNVNDAAPRLLVDVCISVGSCVVGCMCVGCVVE